MRKLTKQLTKDSQGAFLLAVELYNKPTIQYRNQAFSMLLTNAWELLLKAHIYESEDGRLLSIFRPKKPNQKRESITIDEAISRVFTKPNDHVAANIRYISELRNEATHLVIDEFNPYYSRAFQSSVLNYLRVIHEWFAIDGASLLPPGLLALVSGEDFPDMKQIRRKHTIEEFNTLLEWKAKFDTLQSLGEGAALSIHHKLAIVSNPKKADITLSSGGPGITDVAIVERVRDVDETHPHPAKKVLQEVNSRLKGSLVINDYDLQAFLYVHGLKKDNNDYHWKPKHGWNQYSDALVDRLYEAIAEQGNVNLTWRKQYQSHLRQTRASKRRATK